MNRSWDNQLSLLRAYTRPESQYLRIQDSKPHKAHHYQSHNLRLHLRSHIRNRSRSRQSHTDLLQPRLNPNPEYHKAQKARLPAPEDRQHS